MLKLIKKFLFGQTFEVDGFIYKFLKIEIVEDSDDSFMFWVDVELPDKEQSYITPKFEGDIYKIIQNLWKYFGVNFYYSLEEIYVNGKYSDTVYISPKKKQEIEKRINFEFTRLNVYSEEINLDFNTHFSLTSYYTSDFNVHFVFVISISNIESEGELLQPKIETIDDLASSIVEDLYENEFLITEFEEIIYDVLEPEVKIVNTDSLYFFVSFYVNKIDGLPIEPNTFGGFLRRDFFI